MTICINCSKEFEGHKLRKFCSKKCRSDYWNSKMTEYRKEYWKVNKSKFSKLAHERYTKNRESILNKTKSAEYKKRANKLNKTSKRKKHRNEFLRNKRRTNVNYRIKTSILDRIKIEKLKNPNRGQSIELALGYKIEDLAIHLTNTMPDGYSITDYLVGKLELDHIIPVNFYCYLSAGDSEWKKCWSIKNLRLIPKEKNRKRDWASLDWNIILSQNFEDILPKSPIEIYRELKNRV